MLKNYLLIILLILIYSCSGNKDNFKVELRVKGSKGEMMYLACRTIYGTVAVDSAVLDESGKCILKGYTKQPEFYIVYHYPQFFINLIIHPDDNFRILTDVSSFDKNYIVEGSKDSRLIQKMVNMQTRTLEKITDLTQQYEENRGSANFDSIKAKIDLLYEKTFNEHKEFSIDLINKNPGSLATLMALYQQLGPNTPVFDYKMDFKYYKQVDSNLAALYPNSEAVIDLNRKITELRDVLKLESGASAPQIILPDSSNNNISLSSLQGKQVLLVFWASWSKASIDEIKNYSYLYSEAKKNNTEHYFVSLDKNRDSWVNVISDKSIKGLNVSDLKYWDSPAVEAYHIVNLPFAYLIDENGKIITKGFNSEDYSAQLIKK